MQARCQVLPAGGDVQLCSLFGPIASSALSAGGRR
jgi:hypothetical protein